MVSRILTCGARAVSISVVFSINTNGILSVSASVQDEESISNSITITQEKVRLPASVGDEQLTSTTGTFDTE